MSLFSENDFDSAGASSFFKFENYGDTLEGTVTNVKRDVPSKNPTWPSQDVYSVRTEAGVVFQVGASTILKENLRDAGAQPDVLVGIRFLGMKSNQAGTAEYKNWAVVVKKASVFGGAVAAAPQVAAVSQAVVSDENPPF